METTNFLGANKWQDDTTDTGEERCDGCGSRIVNNTCQCECEECGAPSHKGHCLIAACWECQELGRECDGCRAAAFWDVEHDEEEVAA